MVECKRWQGDGSCVGGLGIGCGICDVGLLALNCGSNVYGGGNGDVGCDGVAPHLFPSVSVCIHKRWQIIL